MRKIEQWLIKSASRQAIQSQISITLYWVICINAKLTPTDDLLLEVMNYIENNYKEV